MDPVRGPLTPDDVEDMQALAGTPEQQRAAAAKLAEWASEVHPDDDHVTPALMLVNAEEHLAAAGDHAEAWLSFGAPSWQTGTHLPTSRAICTTAC